jgi:hypothetical protein
MVDELLSFSDELRLHYNIYQDFLWEMKNKNLYEVMEVIFTQHHGINQKFKTVLKTFKKFSDDI